MLASPSHPVRGDSPNVNDPDHAVRRAVLQLGLAALILLPATPPAVRADPGGGGGEPPPNVLVIMTDDQRAGDTLDVMPATREWFGEGGTWFPRAVATTPLCCPSRATIFTGQYAHNHTVRQNFQSPGLNHGHTVQRYLKDEGYRTAYFGKFFNFWRLSRDPPLFDDWAIHKGGFYGSMFNDRGIRRRVKQYSTDFIVRRALQFLRRSEGSDDRPWLMFVAPFAPHLPARAETAYVGAPVPPWDANPAVHEVDRSDKPPFMLSSESSFEPIEDIRARQLRTLFSVDDLVVDLARELRVLDEEQRTLAFFVSDNGYMWGEHGYKGKSVPYPASIGIPFYVRWPGRIEEGGTDLRVAANVDIVPTILDAAGVATGPGQVDGRSLLHAWNRDRILTESWFPPWASIRAETYQYTEWYDTSGQVIFREYYDLVADPWQLTNVLADADPANDLDPGSLVALSSRLAIDRQCAGTDGPAACP